MTAVVNDVGFEELSQVLLACLPRFTPSERRLAITVYRLLAEGRPVHQEELASQLDSPTREVVALLEGERLRGLTFYDELRRVIGFGGLAIGPMHHQFDLDDRRLYTWCAWDSLFLPAMLDREARVASTCPQTGTLLELTVAPERVRTLSHPQAVVSFVAPDDRAFREDAAKTMASFCHQVFFLASPEAGAAWAAGRDGTVLLSVQQAFELGRRKNAVQFPRDAARP